MILTVLGGSAQSTPVLVKSLAATAGEREVTVRLAGLNQWRLAAVARASRLLTVGSRLRIQEYGSCRWEQAIEGCAAVLIQIRIGYYQGRHFDETFPLECGVPGDEGLGPGGLSAAWRAWPWIRRVCRKIQLIAPQALPVLLSSPVGLLVRLAAIEFPGWPLTGVCELPFTTLRQVSEITGRSLEAISFDYVGVNHVGFLYNAESDGEELNLASRGLTGFPSPELIAQLHAFPLKYLRLHYCREEVVTEQRTRRNTRARELEVIAGQSFATFRSGGKDAIEMALRRRRAEWYADAVAPLLRWRMGEVLDIPLFLTIADGEVKERYFRMHQGGLRPSIPRREPPSEVADLIGRFVTYERVAAQAVAEDSEQALATALAAHPWVKRVGCADVLARRIVRQFSEPLCLSYTRRS